MTTIFDKPLAGYRFVDTQVGDTLQKIAFRELGDASLWPVLIAFNNLTPPYLTDDPTQVKKGVLLTGSQILVPAPSPVIESTVDPNLVFDIDVILINKQLVAANGDFAMVAGRDNLRQALSNRIVTTIGDLIFHNDYGSLIKPLIGSLNGPTAAILAAQYASAAVLLDIRVAAVTQSIANITGDTIQILMEVQPVIGRPIQLDVTI